MLSRSNESALKRVIISYLPSLSYVDIDYLDVLLRLLFERSHILNLMHYIESLMRSPKDCVFAVEPRL